MSRAAQAVDGRALRSARSHALITDALYELVGEGVLTPTAEQVAERAGVGLRTVFRLFKDMDSLYATLDERLVAEIAPLVGEIPSNAISLTKRCEAFVDERSALFERIAPYMRATNLLRTRSPFLEEQRRKNLRRGRERTRAWLPELDAASPELFEAIDQTTSFEAWDRLRSDQRLSRARARAVVQRTVGALLRTR